ncbi:hypothetical protein [Rhizobium sp. ZPR3]|uniref:Uncharacterized protein n=2 Tax=unclassified Rhizobium TaxID=2613769 RepID=A0AAU7SF17_9HYPH
MTSRSMRVLVTLTMTLGLATTAAIAAPLADTPDNRDKVVAGVTKMFSTRGITSDRIQQTGLCQVTVDGKLVFDFTQLHGLVELGLTSQFGNGKHVAVTGNTANGGNAPFVCVLGGSQCDTKIEADDVSSSGYATMSAGVEMIKQVCNP